MTDSSEGKRHDAAIRTELLRWLPQQLAGPGHSDFTISALSAPDAGYSGKTVFFTTSWRENGAGDGCEVNLDLVLRMQAGEHQLFVDPDTVRQADVMRRLGKHPGVRTPEIVLSERGREPLGVPFYLMKRVPGRVPSDVPSWHKKGWTTELTADERGRMYDNALRALVAVHRIDDPNDLAFLRGGPGGGEAAWGRYLERLREWYEWCMPDLNVGADVLARALRELLDSPPRTDTETVVWGDARVGNMAFADDLSIAALFDWETATTGPPDIDLGWWLMFERYLCEALGFSRRPGTPDDDEIIRRYLAFGGRLTGPMSYYTLLAAFVLSLITNRLAVLLARDGLPEETARSYPSTAVALVEHYLEQYVTQRRTVT